MSADKQTVVATKRILSGPVYTSFSSIASASCCVSLGGTSTGMFAAAAQCTPWETFLGGPAVFTWHHIWHTNVPAIACINNDK